MLSSWSMLEPSDIYGFLESVDNIGPFIFYGILSSCAGVSDQLIISASYMSDDAQMKFI